MRIPIKYHSRLGSYSVKVQGIPIKAISVGEKSLVDKHINELLLCTLESGTKLVAVDVKTTSVPTKTLLVFYAGTHFLIIHLLNTVPESVRKFLEDDSKFCFVKGVGLNLVAPLYKVNSAGVTVGDLAARVLQKPGLTQANLAEIASEVGVPYEGPPAGIGREVQLDGSNHWVLTEEHVKLAVHDALSFYQIGHQLLTHLKSLEDLTKAVASHRKKPRKRCLKIRIKIRLPSCCFPSNYKAS